MIEQADLKKLNWAFSTLGCPEFTLEQACALATKFGISLLEVRALGGRIDIPAYLQECFGDAQTVQQVIRAGGQKMVVFGTSFKMVGSTPADRDELKAFAACADSLGVPYLRAFGGGEWEEELTDAHISQAVESVNWWRQMRREHGWKVNLLMETHDAFSGTGACLRLFDALDEPIDILWDTHHTWRLAGEDPADSWKALRPRVRHIHFKDSIGKPSVRHPYTYVLPGTGEMPLQPLLEMIAESDYTGAISLEWEKQWHPYLEPLDSALQACRDKGWL